jgi:hypothetical protein
VFAFPDGAFTPIIADYHALYLDGYNRIYQLLPGAAPKRHAKKHRAQKAHHAHKARRAAAKKHRQAVARAKQKARRARAKAKAQAKKK